MMDTDTARQTGRTTALMTGAKPGAAFIVSSGAYDYARRLAGHIHRTDLKIYRAEVLEDGAMRLQALELPGIVVDHDVVLTANQRDGFIGLTARLGGRRG